MFLVSCSFGCMRRKNHMLAHLFYAFELVVQVKIERQRMALVHVIDIHIEPQFVDKHSAANTQDDRLSNAGRLGGIIQTVADRTRLLIVLIKIGGQQENWRRPKSLRTQQKRSYPNRSVMYRNLEHDPGILD